MGHILQNVRFLRSCHTIPSPALFFSPRQFYTHSTHSRTVMTSFTETKFYPRLNSTHLRLLFRLSIHTHGITFIGFPWHGVMHARPESSTGSRNTSITASRSSVSRGTESRTRDQKVHRILPGLGIQHVSRTCVQQQLHLRVSSGRHRLHVCSC